MANQLPTAAFPGRNLRAQEAEKLVDPHGRITPAWRRWTEFVDVSLRRMITLFTFLALDDTPDSYSGQSLKGVRVKSDESGLEFYAAGGNLKIVGFCVNDGSTGTDVALPACTFAAGSFTQCVIVVKSSDASVDLTIDIKQNGTSIFGTLPTVTHGASALSVHTFTSLTSSPLVVAAADVFTLNISSGTSSWVFTAQVE